MNDQNARHARLRHTATGAFAALAAVGAIAGTAALAAKPRGATHRHAAVAHGPATKSPTAAVPDKTAAPSPPVNDQPFLDAVQRLIDNGTITAAEGQVVDRQIEAGRLDTDTLASSGLTEAQLQAVQQALAGAKRALAGAGAGGTGGGKEPPPAGSGGARGEKEPPPAGTGAAGRGK